MSKKKLSVGTPNSVSIVIELVRKKVCWSKITRAAACNAASDNEGLDEEEVEEVRTLESNASRVTPFRGPFQREESLQYLLGKGPSSKLYFQ